MMIYIFDCVRLVVPDFISISCVLVRMAELVPGPNVSISIVYLFLLKFPFIGVRRSHINHVKISKAEIRCLSGNELWAKKSNQIEIKLSVAAHERNETIGKEKAE